MEMEVITTIDKQKRDAMFQELRNSTEANERQVVKFSSVEPVLDSKDSGPEPFEGGYRQVVNGQVSFARTPTSVFRPLYRSNWSVAYPVAL